MRIVRIKVKNYDNVKYKKNDVMLNCFSDFTEDKIDIAVVLEQGNDIVIIDKKEELKEYAIIKVYFKSKNNEK